MMERCTVDLRTTAGQHSAERLRALGWTLYRTGLYLAYFYRRKPKGG